MDIIDKFLEQERKNNKTERKAAENSKDVPINDSDDHHWGPEVKRHRGFPAGTTVNYITVVGPLWVDGMLGKVSHRKYKAVCVAPTGLHGAECGKKVSVTYHQLYYGSVYSCGCLVRPKHPPVRLEGQRFGHIEVLRWTAEYGGAWELLCHTCGELIYRKGTAQTRAAGNSCLTHKEPYR